MSLFESMPPELKDLIMAKEYAKVKPLRLKNEGRDITVFALRRKCFPDGRSVVFRKKHILPFKENSWGNHTQHCNNCTPNHKSCDCNNAHYDPSCDCKNGHFFPSCDCRSPHYDKTCDPCPPHHSPSPHGGGSHHHSPQQSIMTPTYFANNTLFPFLFGRAPLCPPPPCPPHKIDCKKTLAKAYFLQCDIIVLIEKIICFTKDICTTQTLNKLLLEKCKTKQKLLHMYTKLCNSVLEYAPVIRGINSYCHGMNRLLMLQNELLENLRLLQAVCFENTNFWEVLQCEYFAVNQICFLASSCPFFSN